MNRRTKLRALWIINIYIDKDIKTNNTTVNMDTIINTDINDDINSNTNSYITTQK